VVDRGAEGLAEADFWDGGLFSRPNEGGSDVFTKPCRRRISPRERRVVVTCQGVRVAPPSDGARRSFRFSYSQTDALSIGGMDEREWS
jgi:hypothetical protein